MHPDTKRDLIGIMKSLIWLAVALLGIPYLVANYKLTTWLDGNLVFGILILGIPAILSGLFAIFILRSLYRVIRG